MPASVPRAEGHLPLTEGAVGQGAGEREACSSPAWRARGGWVTIHLSSQGRAHRFLKMCSPRDMGWSVVEGEGVSEEMGGVSADVLLELMERLSLEWVHKMA